MIGSVEFRVPQVVELMAPLTLPCDGRKVASVKVREIIRLIEAEGWYLNRTRGSHRQFKHSARPGVVTVPGKPGDDLAPGTQNSILKQAGLK